MPAVDLLTRYAGTHRDRRNITSHFVGVPMIVFALAVLFARPVFTLAGIDLSPAWILFGLAAGWYLTRGDVALGVAVTGALALLVLAAQRAAGGSVLSWLSLGFGCFAVGWLIHTVGHWYEGKRSPRLDLSELLVAPMFITAEALFALGWNKPLLATIEQRVGPRTLRDLAKIA